MERRSLLGTLAGGLAALSACSLFGKQAQDAPEKLDTEASCKAPPGGPGALYFPNVALMNQDGAKALFYRDLVKGKIVTFNVFSTKADAVQEKITANLAEFQKALGDRLGRDVFMYSITLDPRHDTPIVLRQYAKRFGVKHGWSLLTGNPQDIELVLLKLGFRGVHVEGEIMTPHVGLLRYGNEALNRWAALPAISHPSEIVEKLLLVEVKPEPAKLPVRAGPFPSELTTRANQGGKRPL